MRHAGPAQVVERAQQRGEHIVVEDGGGDHADGKRRGGRDEAPPELAEMLDEGQPFFERDHAAVSRPSAQPSRRREAPGCRPAAGL